MLRHQYQEGIFYSQTHVPAAVRFTYELFPPLAERTPKSLNPATGTTRGERITLPHFVNFQSLYLGQCI